MAILIIGKQDDLTSVYIQEKIVYRGHEVLLFDTTKFPTQVQLSFNVNSPTEGSIRLYPESKPVAFSDIKSVFRRWSDGVLAPADEEDPLRSRLVYRNIESTVNSFFRCLDCLWVNSADATDNHRNKAYLLKLLKKQGIRIPETLVTNTPADVIHFYETLNGEVIKKPPLGWASTQKMTKDDLSPEFLSTLSRMPIKMQELIPGVDIRIYLVKDELFAMEIHSETLDFREDPYSPRVPIKLPDEVAETCFQVAEHLSLVYAGIDMRRTPDGEYVFFEANYSPVFLYDEEVTGLPISDRLVDLLLSKI